MEAAIRAYNAGQVRTWRQLSELIMLDKLEHGGSYESLQCWASQNMESAIRANNAGQVRTWRQLSELIMLDK